MTYTVAVPKEDRRGRMIEEIDAYTGHNWDPIIRIFTQCHSYGCFSFGMSFIGIQGWPVAECWNELRETMKSMME